ncbi:MAG TPA: GYD domain-containing protein [Nitrospiraceae bacterium]|nr:GYD domain-containing protein [Nitrospiraceae bacterium]
MGYYLVQAAYTAEAVAGLINNPQNRREAVQKAVEKLGGSLVGFWFAFGDYDIAAVCQMPDNVSAAAFSMAVAAGGALRAFKTTPLMTAEEGIAAMKKAAKTGYKPPKK